jgi:hypothetical protein
MENFGIMLKSYGPDLQYAQRFLESFLKYATEPIPLYVVVPDQDIPAFSEVFASHATVLPESLWVDQLVDYPIHGNNPGYINQEIIKLAFAERGSLSNYLCADSEAVFIRPFSSRDFMDPTGVPYSFITEDHELHVDPIYFDTYWQYRDKWLKTLRGFFQLPKDNYLTCHGFAVLHSEYARNLLSFLRQKDMTIADALQICPYEFSWYNFWVEKNHPESRVIREPIFKTVHIQSEYLALAIKSVTQKDLARGYVGVVINSGFSRSSGEGQLDTPLERVLGSYVDYRDLMGAIFERIFVRAPRVRSLLGKGRSSRAS